LQGPGLMWCSLPRDCHKARRHGAGRKLGAVSLPWAAMAKPKPFTKGLREQFLDRCARLYDALEDTGEHNASMSVTNEIEKAVPHPQAPGKLVPAHIVVEQLMVAVTVQARNDPADLDAGIPLL